MVNGAQAVSRYTPRHPRPRSTLGSPLLLRALGAAGAMITDEYLWEGWDAPKRGPPVAYTWVPSNPDMPLVDIYEPGHITFG